MNVNELPQYKCHKVVRAAKITAVAAEFGDGHCELSFDSTGEKWLVIGDGFYEKHEPRPGKYFVVYEDGYQSVSPAATFEAGYRLVEVGSACGGVGSEEQPSHAEVTLRAIASKIGLDLSGPLPEGELSTVIINAIRGGADDFPDVSELQAAGKYTSGADWAQEANGIDLEAADFSDALMWLKEGKRVCRSGWNGRGQFAFLVKPPQSAAPSEPKFEINLDDSYAPPAEKLRPLFMLRNSNEELAAWVPSTGDLLATDWQVYEELEADIPPHQLRVLEELAQLTDRLDKLTAFFDTDVYRSLDVDERGRLKEQCALMGELQRVLAERVAAF